MFCNCRLEVCVLAAGLLWLCGAVDVQTEAWGQPAATVQGAAPSNGSRDAFTPDALHGSNVGIRALGADRYEVTFRYRPEEAPRSLHVAGSFNGWSNSSHPLVLDESAGHYQARLTISGGEYRYKFVLDRNRWIRDPANPLREADGYGGENSLLRLGLLARVGESRARAGDMRLNQDGFLHDPELPLFLLASSETSVRLRVLTLANDASSAEILRPTAGGHSWGGYPMTRVHRDARFDYYEITLNLRAGEALQYAFRVTDGTAAMTLDANGARAGGAAPTAPFAPELSEDRVFATPEWARHTVWYHLMPDRFRNGDRRNDVELVFPWRQNWLSPAPFEGRDGSTFYAGYGFERMLGGDLQGIIEKLDELQELGISGLYISPVFRSQSFHGYDIVDYRHVEDRLGVAGTSAAASAASDLLDASTWTFSDSDRVFLRLLTEAKSRGIRVILDVPFNHSGNEHLAFIDVRENLDISPLADWYEVTSWDPFEYHGWRGFGKLPEFREIQGHGFASETLRQHLFDVTRRWMDPNGDGDPGDGIDGWRLDASDDVDPAFWADWRRVVKSVNPDALIIGEWWSRADSMLGNHAFDGVTNYQVSIALHNWVVNAGTPRGIRTTQFSQALEELRFAYPAQAHAVMFNHLDSHDTDRALSMLFNPGRDYDRQNQPQSDGPNYRQMRPDAAARARLRMVGTFLNTYIGAPVIFYGTEVGMFGADDPNNRRPMWWPDLMPFENPDDAIDADLRAHFQRLHAIRNTYAMFRTGAFETRLTDDAKGVFAFSRQGSDAAAVVVLNNSSREQTVMVPVEGLRDAVGPVRQWMEVLNSRQVVLVNERMEGTSHFRRCIRVTTPSLTRTRVDQSIEVRLPAWGSAIYVSAQ